jgi:hypothetical protein
MFVNIGNLKQLLCHAAQRRKVFYLMAIVKSVISLPHFLWFVYLERKKRRKVGHPIGVSV